MRPLAMLVIALSYVLYCVGGLSLLGRLSPGITRTVLYLAAVVTALRAGAGLLFATHATPVEAVVVVGLIVAGVSAWALSVGSRIQSLRDKPWWWSGSESR